MSMLKEKLAVLKREYNRTFHRLQRAERAARVKNCIKETIAEQNLLLGQEEAVKNHAGNTKTTSVGLFVERLEMLNSAELSAPQGERSYPRTFSFAGDLSQLSPGLPEESQAGISCPGSTTETTPVLFKSRAFEGSVPETSGSRRAHQPGRRVLFDSVEPPLARSGSQHSTGGSTREQREGLSLATWGETAWEAHRREPERATEQGWESSGFSRSSSLLDPSQRSPESSLRNSQGGSGDGTPTMSDPGSELGRRMQTDVPGATQELPCSLPHASRRSSLEPLSQKGVSGLGDSAAGSRSLCATVWSEEKEEEQPAGGCKEDPGSLAVTPDAARGGRAVPNWPKDDGEPPRRRQAGRMKGTALRRGQPPWRVTPSKEVLSSCTVVEGLMFPLEYYVRMTRTLSRRQKEVNLEAVIQSQLGKGRKGRRAPHKGKMGNPAQPPQELPKICEGDAAGSPPRPPESGGSGQGRRSLRLRRRTQQSTSFSTGQLENPEGSPPHPPEPLLILQKDFIGGGERACLVARRGASRGTGGASGQPEPRRGLSLRWPRALPSSGRSSRGGGKRCLLFRGASWDPPSTDSKRAPQALPLIPLGGQGSRLGWLPPSLPHQEFHLPDEDFGHLKSKKLKVCPEKPLGVWNAGGSREGPPRAPGEAPLKEGAVSGQTLLSGMKGTPSALSSGKLLLSPALDAAQSLLQTPDFPLVGATPAPLQSSPDAPEVSPMQAAGAAFSGPGRGIGWPCSPAGIDRKAREEDASPSQKPLEHNKEPPRQSGPAEEVQVEAPAGTPREGRLTMTSKLKNGSGSCLVDMSAVWWEATDFAELCVVTAEEASISLWRPLEPGQWGTVHTWHFTKVGQATDASASVGGTALGLLLLPVLQIVPLAGAHSVCITPIMELSCRAVIDSLMLTGFVVAWLFFGCAKEELLKAGNINAVLGLADRKLVSSCWSLRGQEVEVFSFSEVGRSQQRWALMPPEETVLAFADVAGLQEALLGMTAMNCIVLWNLGSGQLLKKIPVGWSFPASVCHKAYSYSGLLFLVFSHPHTKDSQLPGNPAFQIVALNPKTARSSEVMLLAPPPGIQGRQGHEAEPSRRTSMIAACNLWRCLLAYPRGVGCPRSSASATFWNPGRICPDGQPGSGWAGSCGRAQALSPGGGLALEGLAHALSPPTSGDVLDSLQVKNRLVALLEKEEENSSQRYLERDVRGSSAAAVLTSGTIAVWDLFLGQCTALLPPNSGGSWSLARWSVTDACLLAGQEDGSGSSTPVERPADAGVSPSNNWSQVPQRAVEGQAKLTLEALQSALREMEFCPRDSEMDVVTIHLGYFFCKRARINGGYWSAKISPLLAAIALCPLKGTKL
ncbi:hypothetical protein E2320_011950, partial [Naja naja]